MSTRKKITPRRRLAWWSAIALCAAGASFAPPPPANLTLTLSPSGPVFGAAAEVDFIVKGAPNAFTLFGADPDPEPTFFKFGVINLGFSSQFIRFSGVSDANGCFTVTCIVDCDHPLFATTIYLQAIQLTPGGIMVSNLNGVCGGCGGTMDDFVWVDDDANGIQDAGELGIQDVNLSLCDDGGSVIGQVTTDATGFYEFEGLCAGCYTVKVDEETIPSGLGPVLCEQGNDSAVDSNCTPAKVVLPTDDSDDPTIDFGYSPCAPCKGKATALSVRYLGGSAALIDVVAKGNVFSEVVQPNEVFTFFGDDKGTLGTEIEVFVNGGLAEKIHTSCSRPLAPGLVFGDFEIVAGVSKDGGPMCLAGSSPCAGGKPQMLTMIYTGEDCSASNNQQGSKAICGPAAGSSGGDPAHILAFDKDGGVLFEGDVAIGGLFVIDATQVGRTKLHAETFVDIYDASGTNVLQSVEFHTSCSQPLSKGDQFGGLVLDSWVLE